MEWVVVKVEVKLESDVFKKIVVFEEVFGFLLCVFVWVNLLGVEVEIIVVVNFLKFVDDDVDFDVYLMGVFGSDDEVGGNVRFNVGVVFYIDDLLVFLV